MPNNYDDDDYDDYTDADLGRSQDGDSELVKRLRKEIRASKKVIKEKDEKLVTLESSERSRTIQQQITEKGLNPKIAGLIPSEIGADPAKLETWLADYGDLFGAAPTGTDGATPPASGVDALDGGSGPNDQDNAMTALRNAKTPEEVQAAIAKGAGLFRG